LALNLRLTPLDRFYYQQPKRRSLLHISQRAFQQRIPFAGVIYTHSWNRRFLDQRNIYGIPFGTGTWRLTDFYQRSDCKHGSIRVHCFPLNTKQPPCYSDDSNTTSIAMTRLKIAKTLTLILLSICGLAGYIVHILLQRYSVTSPSISPYTADQNTSRYFKKHASRPVSPRNTTHIDIHVERAKDEVERLIFGNDGLVRNWEDGQKGTKGYSKRSSRVRYTHPIYRLISEGQAKWAKLLERWVPSNGRSPAHSRQSKTLPQAVSEYKRRYGRRPPKGFEQWWRFARKNGIKIVDDVRINVSHVSLFNRADKQYNQIHRDLEPFFALSPKLFRQRRDQLSIGPHS